MGMLTVGFVLATMLGAIILLRQVRESRARYLFVLLWMVAMFQGLRQLAATEIPIMDLAGYYAAVVDMLVAAVTFAALVVLYHETTRHRLIKMQLRLSQANEPPAPIPSDQAVSQVFDGSPPASAAGQRAEMSLERMIQASELAIITLDNAGRVHSCNAAAERLYSASASELQGRPLSSLRGRKKRRAAGGHLDPAEAHS